MYTEQLFTQINRGRTKSIHFSSFQFKKELNSTKCFIMLGLKDILIIKEKVIYSLNNKNSYYIYLEINFIFQAIDTLLTLNERRFQNVGFNFTLKKLG